MHEHNETLEGARARNVRDALMEDIGRGDWTAQLVPDGRRVQAHVVAKEAAVLCGQAWFDACVAALDATARVDWAWTEKPSRSLKSVRPLLPPKPMSLRKKASCSA